MMGRLENKVAMITGANRGIGRATAELFAQEGAKVVIVDLKRDDSFYDVANAINAAGGTAIAIPGDVTSQADCENAFAKTIETFGRIDILINNAGIADYFCPIERTDDEMWQRFLDVNQTSVFRFCREALKYFVPQDYGVIVNMSAIAGIQGNAGMPYSTTKTAVVGLTKNIAIQYAGTGIRCNALCPGAVLSSMTNPEIYAQKVHQDMFGQVYKHQVCDEEIPPMDPIHQARVMLFLASDESYAITGQAIISDRGKFM